MTSLQGTIAPFTIDSFTLKEETSVFVDSRNRYYIDPYGSQSSNLLGAQLIKENEFYPLAVVTRTSTAGSSCSLIIFIGKSIDSNVVIWKIHGESPGTFASRQQVSLKNLVLMLESYGSTEGYVSLLKAYLEDTLQRVSWAARYIKELSSDSVGGQKYDQFCNIQNEPHSFLFSSYLLEVNSSLNLLFAELDCLVAPEKAGLIRLLYNKLEATIGEDFDIGLSEVAKYTLTRELFCIVTGKHIALDPFGSGHVLSVDSFLLGTKTRFIKYLSRSGHFFIEIRGKGWLDVSTQIIFSNRGFLEVPSNPKWGTLHEMVKDMSDLDKLFQKEDSNSSAASVSLLIDTSDDNIGHIIWNELSGYIEISDLLQMTNNSNLIASCLLAVPQDGSRFAEKGIKSCLLPAFAELLRFVNPYISKSLNLVDSNTEITSLASSGGSDLSGDNIVYVSFKYPKVSQKLISSVRSRYRSSPDRQSLNIFLNIRTHNKAHTNIVECIFQSISDLEGTLEQSPTELIHFYIESFESTNQVDELVDYLDSQSIRNTTHTALDIDALCSLVAMSDMCIAPIGSGAVIPTWVFEKPTVLHADRAHMSQLSWWNKVGGSFENTFPVDIDSIKNTEEVHYADYTIHPFAYSKAFCKAITQTQKFGII